jgi:hypothetical protein
VKATRTDVAAADPDELHATFHFRLLAGLRAFRFQKQRWNDNALKYGSAEDGSLNALFGKALSTIDVRRSCPLTKWNLLTTERQSTKPEES